MNIGKNIRTMETSELIKLAKVMRQMQQLSKGSHEYIFIWLKAVLKELS